MSRPTSITTYRPPHGKVGFTGTRAGMTHAQKESFAQLFLEFLPVREFHHGDCLGSDEEAAHMAKRGGARIISHPPIKTVARAFAPSDETREPKEYLARNLDIVRETDCLIAISSKNHEVRGSGTWATVRRARKYGKRIFIIWPDGKIQEEIRNG